MAINSVSLFVVSFRVVRHRLNLRHTQGSRVHFVASLAWLAERFRNRFDFLAASNRVDLKMDDGQTDAC